jgi:hypothetical protein
MRDWEALVECRLNGLDLEPEDRAEVIAEVATHLEENCEELRGRGIAEEEAVARTLSQVEDWQKLRQSIQSAKTKESKMTNRVTQLWLPGLLTFVLAAGILTLLQLFGPKPWIVALRGVLPVGMLYVPWLLSLPFIGATGAFLSHRAGGSRGAVFSSIVFPVLPFLASILVVLPISLIFDHFIAHNVAPMSLIMALLGWVLAPGVALLAGGLPVQYFLSRRLDSPRIASN